MGARVRLWEVSAYGRLKISSLVKKFIFRDHRCPLMRGVRLREVKNFEFGKEIHFPRPQVSAYERCPLTGG